ncbi:DUF5071 domain-containing protein [Paenibacillus sp. 19GGS1-52]|uniref:DUF5071 domain-containing protein n=1 Tax=Paenibacillus sp. 19GGS1-52 TaxID=2758563 RepID=UPI001EFB1BF4|nr:DUF5071 domain-containing protein [Paenibacillus sp. 19GGS1-52]ULO09067.1 DUF5071 domain-containing protein [Paenibacillus sp. 19GGS1-52]
MKSIAEYINDLYWDKTPEEKTNAIHQLQLIGEKELSCLIQPLTKGHWDGAAEVIVAIGYPRVKSILSELLVWIQDLNWPGYQVIADFLRDIGQPLIPEIKRVIIEHTSDQDWLYYIIECILSKWPTELVAQLNKELRHLVHHSANDLDVILLLHRHGLESAENLLNLLAQKEKIAQKKLDQLWNEKPAIDCTELIEDNNSQFLFRYDISTLTEYLHEIKSTCKELAAL